jgi:hypothetical protein
VLSRSEGCEGTCFEIRPGTSMTPLMAEASHSLLIEETYWLKGFREAVRGFTFDSAYMSSFCGVSLQL